LESLGGPPFEIVGLVADFKNEGVRQPVTPEAYIPYTIASFGGATIFLRTSVPPERHGPPLERELLTFDRDVVPQQTNVVGDHAVDSDADQMTMEGVLDPLEYAQLRFSLILLSIFAAIGLIRDVRLESAWHSEPKRAMSAPSFSEWRCDLSLPALQLACY
jgi:hypothetical protein